MRTIKLEKLVRLAFVNSRKLPQVVNLNGQRMRWVGVGWVPEGKPTGKETLVVR